MLGVVARDPRLEPVKGDILWIHTKRPNARERLVLSVQRVDGELYRVSYRSTSGRQVRECYGPTWRRWARKAHVRRLAEEDCYHADVRILGHPGAVYPGHAITVAYVIVKVFETYEDAFGVPADSSYPNALGSCKIPGAGGNVHRALELLRQLRDGMPSRAAFAYADDSWHSCDSQGTGGYSFDDPEVDPESREAHYLTRWNAGRKQALEVQPLLLRLSHWWEKKL